MNHILLEFVTIYYASNLKVFSNNTKIPLTEPHIKRMYFKIKHMSDMSSIILPQRTIFKQDDKRGYFVRESNNRDDFKHKQ